MAVWFRLRAWEPGPVDANVVHATRDATTGISAPEPAGSGADPIATMTIVDATRASRDRNSASERERRYEELLRTPPPAAPAEPKKTSFLDRMMNPIANALRIGQENEPAARPSPPPRSVSTQPASSSGQQASSTSASETRDDIEEEVDDETDLIPPQLLSAGFTPNEVRDGEETVFAATIQDNLSGVRTVSGVITSPSGSMQGFSCSRETPDGNRYVARVKIPKDAPAGTWLVKYLTLSDNASNSTNLNYGQGALPPTASFRVISAASDAKGPQLTSIWLDRPAMRGGEKNIVFVQAEDEQVGVALVSGVFVSPSKSARIGFGCRLGSGNTWECPVAPPTCLDCGVWRLEQIQLQDKAQNLTTFRQDNGVVGAVALDLTGDMCDAAAPVITSLTFDRPAVTNAQATTIKVQAVVTDQGGCGVASLSGQAIPPGGVGGQRRYISFEPSQDGQTFVGKLEIPQFAAKGLWTISWIQALDKGHNLRAYGATDPVITRATFRVE